jgi:hypothetical protein
MRELTLCQAKNAKSRSTPSASFQLQASHHEKTYVLSSQECQEQMNTISFIPAPATMRELTNCQAKNARSTSGKLVLALFGSEWL